MRSAAEDASSDGRAAAISAPGETDDDADPTVLDDFRGTLDSHGTWVEDTAYGRVWVPSRTEVGPGFVPYVTAGHWAYGDDYVWTSDYSWGWVPFHHGRWVLTSSRGWAWVAGRAYAGAWVIWRVGDDYVGWTATPPTWIWREGTAVRPPVVPVVTWVFCPSHEIFARFVASRIVHEDEPFGLEHRTHLYVPPAQGDDRVVLSGPPPSVLGIEPSRVVTALPRDHDIFIPRPGAVSLGVAAPQRRSPAQKPPPAHAASRPPPPKAQH